MRRPSTTWSVVALSLALAALGLPATSADAQSARVAVAGAEQIPSADVVLSQAITTSFDVALTPTDDAGLSAFITSLSNPASPNYHHYLTPTSFAQRFGASASAVGSVRSYFARYGLRVGALSRGHIVLHVTGSTTAIARAFATSVVSVRRPNGTIAAQFTRSATLPAAVAAHVAGVGGLSSSVAPASLAVAHASTHVSVASSCPATSTSGTTPNATLGGYNVAQQAQAYGLDTAWAKGDTGVGQTIAVYELGLYDPADTATYFSCYALTPTLSTINVDGGPSGTYDEEATLDIEEAAALAPGASIEVYQGPDNASGPIDVYQRIADDNTATIVSTSWGTCEADPQGDPQAEQPIFEQMAAQGQTLVAAAGDDGSSDCHGITNNAAAVDDPASQPYVTGVGGLTVTNISPLSETVWNSGQNSSLPGAGGGGASTIWSRPTWQVASGITGSDTKRMVPDLSTMADPNTGFIEYFTGTTSGLCHRSCSSGWSGIGGTSIGAPLVSALVAVAAQSCATPRLGFINPLLYAMANTGFNDVTTGNNDLFNVGVYNASTGYDMASGLGSPKAGAFIAGLCPVAYAAAESSFSSSPSAITGTPGTTINATLHSSSNAAIANATVNVSASGTSGTVLIDGDQSSSTGTASASYDVTTDANGTASFTVSSSSPGPVAVTVTYDAQSIYSTTITFASAATTHVPSPPSIRSLSALVGGFALSIAPPSSDGGSAVTSYQYSTTNGARWLTIPRGASSVRVTNLVKGRTYRVIARALNARGASASSNARSVLTRT